MAQPYMLMKEYFKSNYYPFDILNHIMILTMPNCNYQLHDTWLLQTPSGELYILLTERCKLRKLQIPPVKKVLTINDVVFAVTKDNVFYRWKINKIQVRLPNIRDIVQEFDYILVITTDGNLCRIKKKDQIENPILSNVKHIFLGKNSKDKWFMTTESNRLYIRNDNPVYPPEEIILPDKIQIKNIKIEYISYALTIDDEVYALRTNTNFYRPKLCGVKVTIPKVRKILDVGYNNAILTLTGELYVLKGCDAMSIKPINMKLSKVKDAIYLDPYIVSLTYDGEVYFQKIKEYSCEKADIANVKEIYAYRNACYAITNDGKLFYLSNVSHEQLQIDNVKEFYRYGNSYYVITYDYKLYSWGDNENGQLALGHTANISIPQQVEVPNVMQILFKHQCIIFITYSNTIYEYNI